ncbi:EPIDERMAL PATTERNING FACTOR-like protein [Musa troglodytarum]|uniref:Epidermal patterning factor-like protein n=1 Tax=Musa troglodytarum TaxID=320322 RepID=A0A9E7FSL3_9LILI|nr:EPIDERMAL PATTERNING FACTOR-like protein [Musa troglodytarum]
MALFSCSVNPSRHVHLLSLLLLLSSLHPLCLTEGGCKGWILVTKYSIVLINSGFALITNSTSWLEFQEGEEMKVGEAMLGSRPPRCEGRCLTCGQCEAIQVPAVPQEKSGTRHFSTAITARGDDSSIYKPLSWKCNYLAQSSSRTGTNYFGYAIGHYSSMKGQMTLSQKLVRMKEYTAFEPYPLAYPDHNRRTAGGSNGDCPRGKPSGNQCKK